MNFRPTIIFSFLDGHVWASWPDAKASVNLGALEGVTEMMRDFLAYSSEAFDAHSSRNRQDHTAIAV